MRSAYVQHVDTLARIRNHPRSGRETILAFRDRKLRSLVEHAAREVPYYREMFERVGLSAADIRTAADLHHIPISSSQDFRTRSVAETISARVDPAALVSRPTSGTTGRPFTIRRTQIEEHLINLFRLRARAQYGVRWRDVSVRVRFGSRSHRRDGILGAVRQSLGIHRSHVVDCLGSAQEILRDITRLQPQVLSGIAGVLAYAGQHAAAFEGLHQPRIVICGGETLTPFRRAQIEGAFGCQSFSLYGAHEFNILAWQCPKSQRFHVCEDNVILEVLRDGRPAQPGEVGEVVATGLHSYAMPFIRYRLGDVVRQGNETCECGQPFSTLFDIRGRMHDYFRLPDGTLMHPDRIVVPIMEKASGWFDQYQLLQEREDRIVLKVSPSKTPSETQLREVEVLATQQLPESVSFAVELVDHVAREPGGKQRYCKSLVNPPIDDFDWSELTSD